jgi:hypothetical protein
MTVNRPQVGYGCYLGLVGRIELQPYEIPMQTIEAPQYRIGAAALPEMWVIGQLG